MPYQFDTAFADGSITHASHVTQFAPAVNAIADNSSIFRADVGSAPNSYRLDYSTGNQVASYTDGLLVVFRVRVGGANTGAALLTITGPGGDLAPVSLTRNGGGSLQSGDLQASQVVAAVYNAAASRFEILGGAGAAGTPTLFGDGSDGAVSLSAGNSVLSRDMYYDSLSLSGGSVTTNGYRIFTRVLDLSNATVGAIRNSGGNASAGVGGVARPANTVGGSTAGTNGALGTNGAGQQAAATGALDPANGGSGGGSRASGAGTNAGAAVATGSTVTGSTDLRYATPDLLRGGVLLQAGVGGRGGSSGGGDGTNDGGAGGGGGGGGGVVAVFARTIITSASTPAAVIRSQGGNGAAGTSPTSGDCGGGSGGAGGGGGFLYVVYLERLGPPVTGGLRAHGGDGATGAAGTGAGTAGGGGDGGGAGQIITINVSTNTVTVVTGNRSSVPGANASGNTPGAGANGRNNQTTL